MEVFLQVVGVLTTIPFTWIYKLLKWAYTWPEEEGIYDRSEHQQGGDTVFGFEEGGSAGFDGGAACFGCADADVGPLQRAEEPTNRSRKLVEALKNRKGPMGHE